MQFPPLPPQLLVTLAYLHLFFPTCVTCVFTCSGPSLARMPTPWRQELPDTQRLVNQVSCDRRRRALYSFSPSPLASPTLLFLSRHPELKV